MSQIDRALANQVSASPYLRPMRAGDAMAIARIHAERIPTAFLSKLGPDLLTQLYEGMHRAPDAFIHVAVDSADQVVGFASATTRVKRMYRSVLLRRGWRCALLMLPHLPKWSTLRWLAQRLSFPITAGKSYPDAELLSIAVVAGEQGSGVANALLVEIVAEYRRRDCEKFRVLVGAAIERSNAFYVKRGFTLTGRVDDDVSSNHIYTIETEQFQSRD